MTGVVEKMVEESNGCEKMVQELNELQGIFVGKLRYPYVH